MGEFEINLVSSSELRLADRGHPELGLVANGGPGDILRRRLFRGIDVCVVLPKEDNPVIKVIITVEYAEGGEDFVCSSGVHLLHYTRKSSDIRFRSQANNSARLQSIQIGAPKHIQKAESARDA